MTTIQSYSDCDSLWATRKRKLANNTYLVRDETPNGPGVATSVAYSIRLHSTNVVTFYDTGAFALNSGGWHTVTTKQRMNEFSPARVGSDKTVWYVTWGGKEYVFADGITFHPDGTVAGAGENPSEELRLRKRIKSYARHFIMALERGDVGEPSNGDCWFCCMREVKTGKSMGDTDTSHLASHIDEQYFVPSLLVNALEENGASQAAKWYAQTRMTGNCSEGWMAGIGKEQAEAAVANYFLRRFGMERTRTTHRR